MRFFPPSQHLACLLLLSALLTTQPAQAWNAAGHRLIARLAWEQMSATTRQRVGELLAVHPDFPRWREKAGSDSAALVFAESASWADEIRNDPRFVDETREPAGPGPGGLPDNARHKRWHYVDLDGGGQVAVGELDQAIVALRQRLRHPSNAVEASWALVWLTHLVGDIHQPLHVGYPDDEGGNRHAVENIAGPRPVFTNLHAYWDDLPGDSRLRGPRLEKRAAELAARHVPPPVGDVILWRDESHALLPQAYPQEKGSLLPLITPAFAAQAKTLAEARLVAAGHRLADLLESCLGAVPHETAPGD